MVFLSTFSRQALQLPYQLSWTLPSNRFLRSLRYHHITGVKFQSIENESRISLPCPFKETEAISALKATEAGAVAALTDLRHGPEKESIMIGFKRAATSLFAAYTSTIDGMGKGDSNVKSKLIGISQKDKARL